MRGLPFFKPKKGAQFAGLNFSDGGPGGGGGGGGDRFPVGMTVPYMGTTAPQGWLLCNGQTVSISDYGNLATHFATDFGSANFFGGDGTTTIAVPDLRGEFLRGAGNNSRSGQGNGANVGVHQDATKHLNVFTAQNGRIWAPMDNTTDLYSTNLDSTPTGTSTGIAGGTESYEEGVNGYYTSRPTSTSVNYIIKY